MFKDIKIADMLIVCILLIITGVVGYYYANNHARNLLWQKTYPIRADIAVASMSCSAGSPTWLSEILTYQSKYNNAPANQIAYIDSQGQLHHCQNGYVGEYPYLSDKVDENTRFRYASVTKLWTSDVILDLIKDKKLSFDTKMVDVLTEIDILQDRRIADITVADLLLHRAGFDRYSVFGQDMFGIGQDICPNHIEKLGTVTLGFDPDTKMSYSNLGYCLLGEMASRIENKPYQELIADRYQFKDGNFAFIDNYKMPDEVAYNYVETSITGVPDIYTFFDYKGLASAAGLSGNAIELAQSVKKMSQKPTPNILSLNEKLANCDMSKIEDCYGYAMFPYREKNGDKIAYYRDGGLLGLSSLVVVGSKGDVVALLSNSQPSSKESDVTVKMKVYQNLQ